MVKRYEKKLENLELGDEAKRYVSNFEKKYSIKDIEKTEEEGDYRLKLVERGTKNEVNPVVRLPK